MENVDETEMFEGEAPSNVVDLTQVVTLPSKAKKKTSYQTTLGAFIQENKAARQPRASERKIRTVQKFCEYHMGESYE